MSFPSSEELVQHLGPPPFRFHPTQPGQAGPAFTRPFKLLTAVLVGAASIWLAQLWQEGVFASQSSAFGISGQSSGLLWLLSALALMLYTGGCILRSRTRLNEEALHQSWIWDKHMALRELAYGRLIRIPGLDWLIAPRLYVRTLGGKFAVFYAADPVLLADFARLVRELAEFRRL